MLLLLLDNILDTPAKNWFKCELSFNVIPEVISILQDIE